MTDLELWNHRENPYPFVPAEVLDAADAVRASLPNKYCNPDIAARLYDQVFEEYRRCDELGLHIVTTSIIPGSIISGPAAVGASS